MTEEDFVAAALADLTASEPEQSETYQRAAPLWQSYAGLKRYWDKRRRTAAA